MAFKFMSFTCFQDYPGTETVSRVSNVITVRLG